MKYNISIRPESRAANTKLLAFVSYAGKRLKYQIARIDAESEAKWNSETSRCAAKSKHGKQKIHASIVNAEIDKFINVVDSFFVVHAGDTSIPPLEELKRFVYSRMRNEEQKCDDYSIFDDYELFIRTESANSGWSLATIQKHRTLIADLKAMSPRLKYASINTAFYSKFADYLTNKGNRTGTVKKKISHLEWFLKWAEANDRAAVDKSAPKVKLKEIERPVIFLSWEELMKLYNLDLGSLPHLERARDMFCFQCFTGLRYSDLSKLKRTQIYDDAIHVTTQKTNDSLTIELNDYSRAVLEKYKDFMPDPMTLHHIPREGVETYLYALPVISAQKYNAYIKEAVRRAEINTPVAMPYFVGNTRVDKTVPKYEVITSHAGRRTFICAALALGIPVTTVMKWSGHKSFDAMKPYINVSSSEKRRAMDLFSTK